MRDGRAEPAGRVVAFPGPEARPPRSAPGVGEPCGQILLFTGVRYERPEPTPGPARPAAFGRRRRRRP
jgi:hypothetical protein